jgi:hypothetical protein
MIEERSIESYSSNNDEKLVQIILWILLICSSGSLATGQQSTSDASNIPASVTQLFKSTGFERRYAFSSAMKPSHLKGDFDGDGKPDTAVLVKQKTSGKIGIAVCHSSTNKIVIIGAGTMIGNGGDNFDWMDIWKVVTKAAAAKHLGRDASALKGDALHVEKSESASALIYWNGTKYVWRQQGD